MQILTKEVLPNVIRKIPRQLISVGFSFHLAPAVSMGRRIHFRLLMGVDEKGIVLLDVIEASRQLAAGNLRSARERHLYARAYPGVSER